MDRNPNQEIRRSRFARLSDDEQGWAGGFRINVQRVKYLTRGRSRQTESEIRCHIFKNYNSLSIKGEYRCYVTWLP